MTMCIRCCKFVLFFFSFLGKACILKKKNCVVTVLVVVVLFPFVCLFYFFFASMRAFEKCANSLQ